MVIEKGEDEGPRGGVELQPTPRRAAREAAKPDAESHEAGSRADHLVEALARAVKKADRPDGSREGLMAFLNSPFSLTLLGGVLVTVLTQTWQCHAQRQQLDRIRHEKVLEQKRGLIADLANRFTTSLYYAQIYKSRELWIREVKDFDDKGTYRDGRSYKETQVIHEQAVQDYLQSGAFDALCARVRASFSTPPVLDRARDLDVVMDTFARAESKQVMREAHSRAVDLYQELLEEMGKELREGRP